MLPLLPEEQETLLAVAATLSADGCVTLPDVVDVHPLASVTV